ncbi:hypothetical protein ACIRPK_20715 [Kitasatospora sp. NPDC101801]|uniref:hypothetical protein n=1 Tax=Kitasatospora sp. NPDC101801 TaxID=3364103 RepID=UPI00382008FE
MATNPEWLKGHQDSAADPFAALRVHGNWLNDPERRARLHRLRHDRELASLELRAKPPGGLEGEVNRREKTTEAKARLDLTQLALDLAQATRLRIALVLRSPIPETHPWMRDTTRNLASGLASLTALLTNAHFTYPVEAAWTAAELLVNLTSGPTSVRATPTRPYLEQWAEQVARAVEILSAAPSVEV